MDKKPSKILWDVPWEEVLALELAKAGYQTPSHVIIHLKNFRRSENFVRLIKCSIDEERVPQALSLCFSIRKMWRSHQAAMKVIPLKVFSPAPLNCTFLIFLETNFPGLNLNF